MKKMIMGFIIIGIMGLTSANINGFFDSGQQAAPPADSTQGEATGVQYFFLSQSNVLFCKFLPTIYIRHLYARGSYVYIQGSDYLLKFDRFGKQLASRKLSSDLNAAFRWQDIHDLIADSSGNMFIAGTTKVPLHGNPMPWASTGYVIKYSPALKFQWCAYLHRSTAVPSAAAGTGLKVAIDSYGRSYLLGKFNDNWPPYIVKFNTDGKRLWDIYGAGGSGLAPITAIDLVIDNGNRLHFLYSLKSVSVGKHNYYLYCLSPDDGHTMQHTLLPKDDVSLTSMTVDAIRGLVIAGGLTVGVVPNGLLCYTYVIKYDASYNKPWGNGRYLQAPAYWTSGDCLPVSANDWKYWLGQDIATDTDGNYYVLVQGYFVSNNTARRDAWLLKIDNGGTFRRAANFFARGHVFVYEISMNLENRIFIAGETFFPSNDVFYGAFGNNSFQLKLNRQF